MKFMLKDKTFNMPEAIRNRFRMIINNITPFEEMIFTILNKKTHEELSLTMDDFMRLMVKNPEKRDDLMIALNLYVENYDRLPKCEKNIDNNNFISTFAEDKRVILDK